jgi:hypothetical protein
MESCQLHATAALYHEKEHQYPLDGRMGGPQNLFSRCEEKNLPVSNPTTAIQSMRLKHNGFYYVTGCCILEVFSFPRQFSYFHKFRLPSAAIHLG